MPIRPVQLLPNYAPESKRNELKTAVGGMGCRRDLRHEHTRNAPGCPGCMARSVSSIRCRRSREETIGDTCFLQETPRQLCHDVLHFHPRPFFQ
jgi:hypothetical protein